MQHFENLENLGEHDWVLLLEASKRLVDIGVINQVLVKPFFIGLAHRLEYGATSTLKSEPFLGYISVDCAYEFLKQRPQNQTSHIELPTLTPLGFVAFLTMTTILYKAIRVSNSNSAITIEECMDMLAQDLSNKVNADDGIFFKSESLRKIILPTFEAFFLKEELFFAQDILKDIPFQGDVLFHVEREKAILLFCIHETALIQNNKIDQ